MKVLFIAVNEETIILTDDFKTLLTKVLRQKVETQEVHFEVDESKTELTTMAVKVAYVTEMNKVVFEIVNVQNLKARENKKASRIQIYVRLSPDRSGLGQQQETSQIFEEVGESIIFDLMGEQKPLRFCFDIDHLSAKKQFEDGFIIVNLFHVNRAGLKMSIGECVCQVS